MKDEDANLKAIDTLRNLFKCKVGYSGHEVGLQISLAAVAMGATSIERHITLDRTMYGSDQASSIEPGGLMKLVRDIRIIEKAFGNGEKVVGEKEQSVKDKLRPLNWR
jgi:N-acetylneuraminate synthase